MRNKDPQHRYRRILYPVLSGGFGFFAPRAALAGLVFWAAVGAGLASAATADLAYQRQLPGFAVVVAMANPGILMSATLLTPDVLALGLAMSAIPLWLRRRRMVAILCLSLAVLTKETHLIFVFALAFHEAYERRFKAALVLIAIPGLTWGSWSLWCRYNVVHGTTPMHNFAVPGAGLLQAMRYWLAANSNVRQFAFAAIAIFLVVLAFWSARFSANRIVSICSLLWALVAMVASISVWYEPSNVIRAIAPLWPLVCLNLGEACRARQRIVQSPKAGHQRQ